MLRAGLVGLPSSGKTTLFQLLTSAREAARTHGKAEANVGVSRVPDGRLDQLTAMFQPKKRTAATVEFADMAAARGEAVSLLDVVAYRNADALLTSCARFAIRWCRIRRRRSIPCVMRD
jgi:ATPase subunit of ABC transporter with duplicated ATPase domains